MGFIDEAIKWLKDIWDKDSNKILTAATVMGVGVVAVESFKAGARCEQNRPLVEAEIKEKEEKLGKSLTKMEKMPIKLKIYGPLVVPPLIFGSLEIFGIHLNNKIAMDKVAGLSYILSRKEAENKALKEEMHKVLSEKEANKVEENVIQKQADESGAQVSEEQLKTYTNQQNGEFVNFKQLFYEPATNLYFFSTKDEIMRAVETANKSIAQGDRWTTVNSWLWYIDGLTPDQRSMRAGEVLGYTQDRNSKYGCNLNFDKLIYAPNGLPAIVVSTDFGEKDYGYDRW